MRNKFKVFIFLQLLVFFTISQSVYAWDNPNKPAVNTGVYALKTVMIGSYMDGFNDGKNGLSKDEEYTDGDNKDFLKYYEKGYSEEEIKEFIKEELNSSKGKAK